MKVISLLKNFISILLVLVFVFLVSSQVLANNPPQEKHSKKEMKIEKQTQEKDSKTKKEETELKANKDEDLVCVVTGEEADTEIKMEYKGKTYYFCCHKCLKKFKSNPEKYIKSKE